MKSTYADLDHEAVMQLMEFSPKTWCITALGVGITPETRLKYRNNGYASNLLLQATGEADIEGVILVLSVDPDPDIDPQRLRKLYRRFAFQAWEGKGDTAMIRYPQHRVQPEVK